MDFTADHYLKLIETLRWRRDIRHFRTDPIEPGTMAAIEATVDLAPSVGNSRLWRIIRVNSSAHRQAVIRRGRLLSQNKFIPPVPSCSISAPQDCDWRLGL